MPETWRPALICQLRSLMARAGLFLLLAKATLV